MSFLLEMGIGQWILSWEWEKRLSISIMRQRRVILCKGFGGNLGHPFSEGGCLLRLDISSMLAPSARDGGYEKRSLCRGMTVTPLRAASDFFRECFGDLLSLCSRNASTPFPWRLSW